ncbi:MAG: hypothetical protein E6R03_02675 [Hyphomicrobiaceae bacterium]|nr:MAG: hypothetical protein E6R03_02675 [Hyphomicrobiaceae bacterium]
MSIIIDQVLTPDAPHPTDPQRNVAGQFVKGSSASPGRRKRSEEQAILTAIDAACPPEELQKLLGEAITWAREYKSPKAVMAIAQFVVGYRIGTPVQRSISASGKLENLLSRLGEMDEDEFSVLEAEMRRG